MCVCWRFYTPPPVALLNIGVMENEGSKRFFYKDGVSPLVADLIQSLDTERLALLAVCSQFEYVFQLFVSPKEPGQTLMSTGKAQPARCYRLLATYKLFCFWSWWILTICISGGAHGVCVISGCMKSISPRPVRLPRLRVRGHLDANVYMNEF